MNKFKQLENFIKSNFLLIGLILYGLIIMLYKSYGSFLGDEATYSQIAKEGLLDHSYLIMRWKTNFWFEKPPLTIWLTELSFKLFGISERSAHIFPGIFSIASVAVIYFFSKELFKSKLAGFFSGFVFLSTPIILMYSRTNMMDIPAGTFIALAMLSIWKIFEGKNRWWLVLGVSLASGAMTKSIIGFFPLVILAFLTIILRKYYIFKNNYWKYGAVVFFGLVLPWHIYMTGKFGLVFWKDYLGFHIFDRFFSQILPYPWEGNSAFGYVKLFFLRSGIWFYLFLLLTFGIIYFWKKRDFWFSKNKSIWIIIYSWLLAVTVPFFLAVTKLPNYMILAFYPISIATGGYIAYLFRNAKWKNLAFLCSLSLLNFLPVFRLNASDFGEAHFLIPKIFIRYFAFSGRSLIGAMCLGLIGIIYLLNKFKNNRHFIFSASLAILIGMNMLIPFNPYRNEFIKNFGRELSDFSKNRPVNLYVKMKEDQYSFHCVGAYYLPFKSQVENLGQRKAKILPKNDFGQTYCFFEKSFLDQKIADRAVLSYPEGKLFRCVVENRDLL